MATAAPALPCILLTGGSGFLGRHVLEGLADRFRFVVIARRTQAESRAPVHPNITWLQADLAEPRDLHEAMRQVQVHAPIDFVFHFAAYYDFTGEEDPEYQRTNVEGLQNILRECEALRPKRFVFSSSLAACELPRAGETLTELNTPNGSHVYARSKAQGEALVRAAQEHFPTCIVRLGCLFSDYCEYPPLFMFFATWLSDSWKARILGGTGQTAIPYLHIRDGVAFFRQLLERHEALGPAEIVIASTDAPTSHLELFEASTAFWYGRSRDPILMPKYLAWVGMVGMDVVGRVLGDRPFERPWMGAYIDTRMTTDARHTRELLGWKPNPRLALVRRIPFLLENLRVDPLEWNQRNLAAMKAVRVATHLQLFHLLDAHEDRLVKVCSDAVLAEGAMGRLPSYAVLPRADLDWSSRTTFLALKNAIRTRDHGVFRAYCRDIAERRYGQGFACREVLDILRLKRDLCLEELSRDPETVPVRERLDKTVRTNFSLGLDEVVDVYEALSGTMMEDIDDELTPPARPSAPRPSAPGTPSPVRLEPPR